MTDKTKDLMDEEARLERERREKIGRVAMEIEAIILKEDLTMGDFLEVTGLFTERANTVFADIKIKKIKDEYARR